MRAAILELTPADLRKKNGRGTTTVLDLVTGIAAHDLYHAGQIQLIKRLHRGAIARILPLIHASSRSTSSPAKALSFTHIAGLPLGRSVQLATERSGAGPPGIATLTGVDVRSVARPNDSRGRALPCLAAVSFTLRTERSLRRVEFSRVAGAPQGRLVGKAQG